MRKSDSTSTDTAVRSFQINIAQEDIDDLKRRVKATRWPEKETVNDDTQGVRLEPLQQLAKYWADGYDWRKIEAKLNALPQFMTRIDDLDIHFIHVRSKHENALPIIITHGWPGSIIEQMKLIGPLTDPTAHGGTENDAFHVVIPSIPGYGFSGKPTTTGWDPQHIARAWVELMKRLGYNKFVAQGGDWGGLITDAMGAQAAPELIAIHSSLPGAVPADLVNAIMSGAPMPEGLSDEEKHEYGKIKHFVQTGIYYAIELATRVQTLYCIADSPVGLAAWMIDHGDGDGQPAVTISEAMLKPSNGNAMELNRDDVLDNITLYWLTNTGVSSGRIYWENKMPFFLANNVNIPVAVSAFPGELYTTTKSWAEKAYPKLMYYNRPEKGGHFAAWEQPLLFTNELRAAFKSIR